MISTFLGLVVDNIDSEMIHMHMDVYGTNVLEECKAFVRRSLRPEKLPNAPKGP